MATYAIGDVQGCFDELTQLLDKCQYRKDRDRLWFVGDLVNRGPQSLEVLRSVRELGDRAVTVLGNHDLHLVMQHEGFERKREDDTFGDVLQARDAKELVGWVRTRPMMHVEGGYAMVHAGLLPQWTIEKASKLAREVEVALAARDYRDFLANMYGSTPDQWNESLSGWDRLRVIVNAMTRMRYVINDGAMEFRAAGSKAPPAQGPENCTPWFDAARRVSATAFIVCGHWSALGLVMRKDLAAIDTGCLWGGSLTALRLEDRRIFCLPSRQYVVPRGWD